MLAENSRRSFRLSLLVGRTRVICYSADLGHSAAAPLTCWAFSASGSWNLWFPQSPGTLSHIIQASAYTELPQRGFCWPFSPEWLPHRYSTTAFIFHLLYVTIPLYGLLLVSSVLFVPLEIEARALGMLSQQWPLSHITALEFAIDSCFLHSLSRFH